MFNKRLVCSRTSLLLIVSMSRFAIFRHYEGDDLMFIKELIDYKFKIIATRLKKLHIQTFS
jgi:hypothetical protein